jgi:hypothetical protein
MITGVWRAKYWRYVLIAAIVVNLLLINQFVFDNSIQNLNPFSGGPSPYLDVAEDTLRTSLKNATTIVEAPPSDCPVCEVPTQKTETFKQDSDKKPETQALISTKDYDFNGAYIGWPLEEVCNEVKVQKELVFICDNNSGGIGNIRNFILTCIRYAIDAGASGIVIPRIQLRSEENLANIFTTGFQPLGHFFDEDHFRHAMGTYCPRMKIYDKVEDIPNSNKTREIREFYPKDLNVDLDGCDGRGVNRHLDMFRTKFDAWLKKSKRVPTEKEPVTIRLKWATFFEWPVYRDGPEFATTFGDLLRIRRDIQDLAARTLMEMSRFMGNEPDSATPNVLNAPYLGVHLRTESDALGFWPNFKTQSEGYLKTATTKKLTHAYLACGNATDGHRFADLAASKLKLNVTTKLDLLKGSDLEELTKLSWDQQALVDYLMLMKSDHFSGCSFSSFTMNIAMKRHLMTNGIKSKQWRSPGDQFSTLIGRFESWYGDWMFMYECMWP